MDIEKLSLKALAKKGYERVNSELRPDHYFVKDFPESLAKISKQAGVERCQAQH